MRPQQISTPRQSRKLSVVQIVLLASLLVVCGFGIVVSTAQAPLKDEREFNDTTPKHLPIKITLKNAEKTKNLQNEDWLKDLEIEVENRSHKPIYFLELFVILDDVTAEDNHHLSFPLQYGRGDLIDLVAPLQADDVPIKPGERYTFKITEDLQQGWARHAARGGLRQSAPRKLRLRLQMLNFGDGTGFATNSGVPLDIHAPPPLSSCVDKRTAASFTAALNALPDGFPGSSSLTRRPPPAGCKPNESYARSFRFGIRLDA